MEYSLGQNEATHHPASKFERTNERLFHFERTRFGTLLDKDSDNIPEQVS